VRSAKTNPGEPSADHEPSLPIFTSEQVNKHKTKAEGIWMSYQGSVYDLTDFVDGHPGGEKILLAAGGAIEPFWRVYKNHDKQSVRDILQSKLIGRLDASSALAVQQTEKDSNCPYANDPDRHPALKVHSAKPCNAEVPQALMMDSWLTPSDLWYVRNHHPVPDIDAKSHKLELHLGLCDGDTAGTGAADGPSSASMDLEEMQRRYTKQRVTTTIQCGGNRRGGHNSVRKTSGTPWGFGAISTAEWGGVYLRDVLKDVYGISTVEDAKRHGAAHVHFYAAEGMRASIPIHKALSEAGDVLLAWEMNGAPLSREHGAPLRAIVPGHVGVRNVKWLTEIKLGAEEVSGPWQRGASYKWFPPSVRSFDGLEKAAIAEMPSMQENPVQSVIVSAEVEDAPYEAAPAATRAAAKVPSRRRGVHRRDDDDDDDDDVPADPKVVTCSGYAISGGGRGIARVEVSADGGQSWHEAVLGEGKQQPAHKAWAWTFWEATVAVPPTATSRVASAKGGGRQQGGHGASAQTVTVCCRAIDTAFSMQPEDVGSVWNLRGLNNNSWHTVSAAFRGCCFSWVLLVFFFFFFFQPTVASSLTLVSRGLTLLLLLLLLFSFASLSLCRWMCRSIQTSQPT
jgi:sulfite oxidase